METKLKPYMGFVLDEPQEGAILIFAKNRKEAKKIGWSEPSFIHDMADSFIDFRVLLLKEKYIYSDGNQEKLNKNVPHIIESPTCCKGCNLWGEEFNKAGFCQSCWEFDHDQDDTSQEWEAN